ncbi:RagB/SusD family nutrient uptake outer membrane protein [Chitinophagaceae bacterium LB-8]|uniref:RagB/SusD family nutrient uptake outer membrane protein n=1 Tax=Paraflavisolibacter caeni TaxID=2982496 RepID=A0A9X2XW84_9BACT|nr:RagB/SusD family nutrient uptake outer membrane protein [Paraflavisolibacter caeni]MCU7549792.1 RagB/SusD family nutrient uptake outer membrane protein [Paraflavisolibacter caeni]
MKKYIIALICIASFLGSCKKYLDIIPDNVATLEYAFRNRNETENYLFSCYNQMQSIQRLENNPGWTASGELTTVDNFPGQGLAGSYSSAGFFVIRGFLSPYGTAASTNIYNDFSQVYVAIRRCNTLLENLNMPKDLSLGERVQWTAEAKALKAFYYFYLVRKYGPVPLVKENLPVSAETEEVKLPRAPSDSIFSYINTLINEAAPDLPDQTYDLSKELGRFNKIMVSALKAKAAVLQASPLFNGDPDFKKLANRDGTPLLPAQFDPKKWTAAAAACKEAIDLCNSYNISLYRYSHPANLGYLPDSLKLLLSIQGPINFERSSAFMIPEIIWPSNAPALQQRYLAPLVSTAALNARTVSPMGALAVPIAQAELYYTNNGVPINEDINYNYAGRYAYSNGTPEQKFYVQSGYPMANLHQFREPRFYADLAFDGGVWYGMGTTTINNLLYLSTIGTSLSNWTGYWAKKLVNYQSKLAPSSTADQVNFYIPGMRLADLYLLYAEAQNEASGPGTEAYRYIDSVRARAGLKGVVESWAKYSSKPDKPLTKEGLRSIIHQERRIELCFEGEVGWDLKRWKEYLQVLSEPLQGWNASGMALRSDYYKRMNLFTPVLGLKNYFWPFHESVILNNSNIVQNLYW